MISNTPLRLTQTVQKGGCAAKVAATELRQILARVQFPDSPPALLIGSGSFDDAAVYQLNAETALVQTLDFFTPIVDTPKIFGRIAAANALSDVYAMGGRPLTAMAIFAFPLATMEHDVAVNVLQGASEIIEQAQAAFVGGHTIDDDTMKFGLSVTGLVHPERIWSNAGAKPGDILILTKALGTGTLTAALKRGETDEDGIEEALQSMMQLNQVAEILSPLLLGAIHAATDITGFGMAGHALNLARASQVSLQIQTAELPRFTRALEFLEKGFLTKAHRTNFEYVDSSSHFENVGTTMQQLVFDPQTSGGLLLSVEPVLADAVLAAIKIQFPAAQKVGQVIPQQKNTLQFR